MAAVAGVPTSCPSYQDVGPPSGCVTVQNPGAPAVALPLVPPAAAMQAKLPPAPPLWPAPVAASPGMALTENVVAAAPASVEIDPRAICVSRGTEPASQSIVFVLTPIGEGPEMSSTVVTIAAVI